MSLTLEALRRIQSKHAVLPASREARANVDSSPPPRQGDCPEFCGRTPQKWDCPPWDQPQAPADVVCEPPSATYAVVEEASRPAVCAVADESPFVELPLVELPAEWPATEMLPFPESTKIVWPNRAQASARCERLVTRLLDRHIAGRPTTLLFTSPGDGEGKTELVITLAPVFAARAQRGVLVVDADFRRSNLSTRLTAFNDGLAGLLTGSSTLADVACPTTVAQLSILPYGDHLSQDEESEEQIAAWEAALEEMKCRYPLVLLDAPSLAHPHVGTMASSCDGVCLVVRLGQTSRRAVREAVRVIEACDGRLLGCIAVSG